MSGEQRLWQEVLLLAINDVARSRTTRDMANAISWFKSERCRDICFLMGIETKDIRKLVLNLAQRSPAQRTYWVREIKSEMGRSGWQGPVGRRKKN